MNEREWVELIAAILRRSNTLRRTGVVVKTGLRIPYGFEIEEYGQEPHPRAITYETDLALVEDQNSDRWKPRVVVEAKIGSITTHDAITYSQKAAAHRNVFPYLRYGVALGRQYPLPGRLYRHGTQFDFMICFRGQEPRPGEVRQLIRLLADEVAASKTMEKFLYESRKSGRDRYTVLHRKLVVA